MYGAGENETLARINLMPALPVTISGEIQSTKKDDRVPQWSHRETRDFIAIRAELEKDFTVAKRNKTLWEIVAAKMKERGYRRSPDQCKCKWKNLVNRYKETSDPENGRQCPFFDELQAVFTERAKNMQRLLLESEAGGGVQARKKVKRITGDRSSDDFSEDDDDDEEVSEEERVTRSSNNHRKRKAADREKQRTTSSRSNNIQEILQEFLQQQQRMEMQWREVMERRVRERQLFEQEWRQSMEKLERERMVVEQAWREREEQRRVREESRAEKRDALLTTLLNKLIHEDHP
ncbi:hypothetical protein HHK36_028423 [Tetracentron sinense]|uniref:Myb-like domain-containing protein n=1 Tax=Tetracentron sinense TaxID=13715 RepID=A0A834YBB6_TETSI|nr:hypothetical protein HHK36_028423 [Tetracentron sinense]